MGGSLTDRRVSTVGTNGGTAVGLRVPTEVLKELGWKRGTLVHWRVVGGRLEGFRVILQEA